ncbi:MAG: fibronectin type III domain-containing protein [Elusimicrobiota bacterium]
MQSRSALSYYLALLSLTLFCVIIIFPIVRASGNIDVGADDSKYSYSETAGWFNWNTSDSGVIVSTGYLSGYLWHENLGWVHLGTAPANGLSYANDSETDYGINRDTTTGQLFGYAYGENAGWINFNPDYGGVSISTTGVFGSTDTVNLGGWAWGENIGWMCFSSDTFRVRTSARPPAPSEFAATDVGVSSITWSWTDNSSGWAQEDGFRVYYATAPGTIAGTAAQDAISFEDTGLLPDTTYSMYVQSYNTAWSSDLSASAAATGFTAYPPGAITDLAASVGTNEGEINLTWSAVGDDGADGDITGGKYKIKWSTQTESDWESGSWTDWANRYEQQFSTNTTVGANQYYTLTGLTNGTTYYVRVWTADEAPNWSAISNGATTWAQIDVMAPSAVTDLSATPESDGDVQLTWTAVGDDGLENNISGGQYTIKWSTQTESDWESGSWADWQNRYELQFSTTTSVSRMETKVITGLTGDVPYYFRLWTADERLNRSAISNGATCQVTVLLSVDIGPATYGFGVVSASSSTVSSSSFTITNLGNVAQKYSVKCSSSVPTEWYPVSISPDTNIKFRLLSIFNGSTRPQVNDFDPASDYLAPVNTYRASGSGVDGNFSGTEEGVNVPVGDKRGLWLRLDTPAPVPTSASQSITITIQAEQQ